MSSSRTRPKRPLPDRVGSALILVLIMTAGLAALAMSAIFLASSSGLMTQYYDRERNYRYAAEQALQIGLSELAKDTAIHLADTGYIQLMTNASLTDANGVALPNAIVNLYVGMTGNTTGEFGQFASLVAEVNDQNGNTKYVRRLELMASMRASVMDQADLRGRAAHVEGDHVAPFGLAAEERRAHCAGGGA